MGFFSSLWDEFTDVALTAVTVALSPVLVPAVYVDEWLNSSSSAAEVRNIEKELENVRSKYIPAAQELESRYKDDVSKTFDSIINKLKENEELANSFGMDKIERRKKELVGKINGAMTDSIRKSFSLDNTSLRKILEMNPDDERTKKLEEFNKNALSDAQKNLAKIVSDTFSKLTKEIVDFLQKKLADKERAVTEEKNRFDDWERDKNNKSFNEERAQLPAREKLYAIEQIEKKIAA